MPDQIKPHEKNQQTDEERRKAAAKASAQDGSAGGRTQVHAETSKPGSKSREPAGRESREESFEHAGRGVRAQPSNRQDLAKSHQSGSDEDADSAPSEDDERARGSEDSDSSDASSPIDDRTERKTRAQETADEEER